jgi:aspartyl-tRNA(Asn)/glutamyl-tRNA(Gln) amidotransferase subunit A
MDQASRNQSRWAEMSELIARLEYASIAEVSRLVTSRELTVEELVSSTLDRIQAMNPRLNALITVLPEEAIAQARNLDRELEKGHNQGPLHGIPVVIKDNLVTAGIRTTAGSRVLRDWVPAHDATLVTRLRQHGAIVVGKANLYEFAFAGFHEDYGETHNPWDLHRSCSSSSSGSAAAVAAGLAYASIGSDHGGSIRLPAAVCGVVGMKPTAGLVSRAGILPDMYTLDHVGPIGRTVEDVAIVLAAIAGPDPADPSTLNGSVEDYRATLNKSIAGVRIGVPDWHESEVVEAEVRAAFEATLEVLEAQGATLKRVSPPDPKLLQNVSRAIGLPEISASHRQWINDRWDDYSPKVRDFIKAGEFIPATAHVHAHKVRATLVAAYDELMTDIDLIASPTIPFPAWLIDQDKVTVNGRNVSVLDFQNLFTPVFNVTGQPALAIPCGFTRSGLPLSLQLASARGKDATVLRAGHAYEQATQWHVEHPALPI